MRIKDDFVYAVSRIRCKEKLLMNSNQFEQIIGMNDTEGILRFLSDNGWDVSADDVFLAEEKRLWNLTQELSVGDSFDFLRSEKDFHNLKACVKGVYMDINPSYMFVFGGSTDPQVLYKNVKEKNFKSLPSYLQQPAQSGVSALLRTADGKVCDRVLDKASLETTYYFGKRSSENAVRDYCEAFVACANIRIASRGLKHSMPYDDILSAMVECESLDIETLAVNASRNLEDLCEYLSTTVYSSGVSYLKDSLSALEKWCDNYILSKVQGYKYDQFTIAPLIAYILKKETEIKTVKLIYKGKKNKLDDSMIRERVRMIYV